jgi:CTP:molybdopterin cytidylyltransferase MocA
VERRYGKADKATHDCFGKSLLDPSICLWGSNLRPLRRNGAGHLIGSHAEAVTEVAAAGSAVLTDVDTPDALDAAKAEIEGAR